MTSPRVDLVVDGAPVSVTAGATVAAALLNTGQSAFRASVSGEPRGPLCGMGICYECRVTIDGVAHQRACMRIATRGMRVVTLQDDAR